MKSTRIWAPLAALAAAASAVAQTSASGVISLINTVGGMNTYDIRLTNTGSTGIQTFWFAWVEAGDLDFLPTEPSNVTSPTGWSEVTNGPGTYSLEWFTDGGLAAGDALSGFQFTTTDTMADLMGTSQGYPILTSVVYSGQPLTGTSATFLVVPAPEPCTWLGLGAFTVAALAIRRRRRPASSF